MRAAETAWGFMEETQGERVGEGAEVGGEEEDGDGSHRTGES